MDHENDGLLIHVSRWAMACRFEVCFPVGRREDGTRAALDALDRVESLEAALSYFRPTSEIARLNRLAAHGGVEVDADLFALLALALKVCAEVDELAVKRGDPEAIAVAAKLRHDCDAAPR